MQAKLHKTGSQIPSTERVWGTTVQGEVSHRTQAHGPLPLQLFVNFWKRNRECGILFPSRGLETIKLISLGFALH